MFYVNLMVTTKPNKKQKTKKPKPIVDKQKRKRKKTKHITMENHQITKEDRKRGRKEQRKYKTA